MRVASVLAIVRGVEGEVVSSVSQISKGDSISTMLTDGEFTSEVTGLSKAPDKKR